jgi:hypothetical protein
MGDMLTIEGRHKAKMWSYIDFLESQIRDVREGVSDYLDADTGWRRRVDVPDDDPIAVLINVEALLKESK